MKPPVNMYRLTAIVLSLAILCVKCAPLTSQALTSPHIPPSNGTHWRNYSSLTRATLQLLLDAESRMGTLKFIQESMFNSTLVREHEEDLYSQLRILSHLYKSYGITLNDPTWQRCGEEYLKQKQVLMLEVASLGKLCQTVLTSIRTSKKKNKGLLLPSALLKVCGDETLQLYLNAEDLTTTKFYQSFGCSLEASTRTLTELAKTNYFEHVDKKNELLGQELEYLMVKSTQYIQEMDYGHVSKDKYFRMMDRLELFSKELKAIKGKRNRQELQAEIAKFRWSVERNIPAIKQETFKEGLNNVSHYVVTDVFDRYLRIPVQDMDEKMKMAPTNISRFPMVVQEHNRLVEMILEVTDMLPINIAKGKGTQSAIYSGKSLTLGKPCENSPNHLVGTCTPENNEICVITPDWNTMDIEKAVINSELLIFSKSMLLTKYCTCGFHVDCVPIASTYQIVTEYSTCFLIPNKNGQCRGGVGYPCGSLPLAENKFDESCASETCNQKENECA